MSTSLSDAHKGKKRAPARASRVARTPSASEIARNIRHFETWSSHQGCEQVSYLDIPDDLRQDVSDVFNAKGRLPTAWLNESSIHHKFLSEHSPPGFIRFLKDAYSSSPQLFSDENGALVAETHIQLFSELICLYHIYDRLRKMQKSKEKYSEADYAGCVYNPIRIQAVTESRARFQCGVSLPQPIGRSNLVSEAVRVLNAKTVIPDFSIFVTARGSIRDLSHGAKSPFNILKGHSKVRKCGHASRGSSFRFQATPCVQLPETPGFEFISSVFEDKKPNHTMLDDAYRQNRMATAAAARHLHSLRICAPVFGLVWANGIVRAHVDWCHSEEGKRLTVFSAPYPSNADERDREDLSISRDLFHEWELNRPSDILQVYFLVKNIDKWTAKKFRQRVIDGVQSLVHAVENEEGEYKPWKRVGELTVLAAKENNISTSISASSTSTPPKPRSKRHRR